MNQLKQTETLIVLYDGGCPLCMREIRHVKSLAERRGGSALQFVDVSSGASDCLAFANDREKLLARFHVQRSDGSRLSGAEAFVAMWARLPGWRWLARLAGLPGGLTAFELAYRGFLRVRPGLQWVARRAEGQRER